MTSERRDAGHDRLVVDYIYMQTDGEHTNLGYVPPEAACFSITLIMAELNANLIHACSNFEEKHTMHSIYQGGLALSISPSI